MKKNLVIILLALFLAACQAAPPQPTATPTPEACNVEDVKFSIHEFANIIEEWQDANKVAGATSKIALSPQINVLNEIKRKTNDLDVPRCLEAGQDYLVSGMEAAVTGYLDFMADKPDKTVSGNFATAADLFAKANTEFVRINACAPNCE